VNSFIVETYDEDFFVTADFFLIADSLTADFLIADFSASNDF
jgi:hypothetical protein